MKTGEIIEGRAGSEVNHKDTEAQREQEPEAKTKGGKKTDNHEILEIHEKGKEVGLVELVPPMEAQGASDQGKAVRGRSLQTATGERGGMRAELVEVLEQFGISVAGFDRLRSDSYEKQIAGRSLAELEQFYERLLAPMSGYVEMMPACPKWGKDAKPPHWTTLQRIKERIMNEQSVREHLAAKGLMEARKVDGQGTDDEEVFSGEALEILAEELLVAKTKGKPISENLKIVDRLLKSAMIGIRQRRERREEAKFKWIQAGRPIQREPMTGTTGLRPSGKPDSDTPVSLAEEYDPEAMDETDIMLEKVFGKNPYKDQGEIQKAEAQVQGNSKGDKTVESPGDDRQQSKVESQTGTRTDNREIDEIRETKQTEKKKALPEWATKPGSIRIGAPSAKHPKGIKKSVVTNLPVDVVTDEPVLDVPWETLIGFGGDGEKALN